MAQLEVVAEKWFVVPTSGIHPKHRKFYNTDAVHIERLKAVEIDDRIGVTTELSCRRALHPTFHVPNTWLIRQGRQAAKAGFKSVTIPEKFGKVFI